MTQPEIPEGNPLPDEIGRLVQAVAAAGQTVLLGSADALLDSIVEAAARIFGAAAASILLVKENEGVLEFKVAYGGGGQKLVGVRIPLNQGIAGYVAMSGQPISISDVIQDTRFNQEFAKSTGYVPRSILATPLITDERVIGVMEVLDKINAPSFGMLDMELLGLFARQAALAIDLAEKTENLSFALVSGLKRIAFSESGDSADGLFSTLEAAPRSDGQEDLLNLVDLLSEFGRLGETERGTALKILAVFAGYSRQQRKLNLGAAWR